MDMATVARTPTALLLALKQLVQGVEVVLLSMPRVLLCNMT